MLFGLVCIAGFCRPIKAAETNIVCRACCLANVVAFWNDFNDEELEGIGPEGLPVGAEEPIATIVVPFEIQTVL